MSAVPVSRRIFPTCEPPTRSRCQRVRWLEPITIWVIWRCRANPTMAWAVSSSFSRLDRVLGFVRCRRFFAAQHVIILPQIAGPAMARYPPPASHRAGPGGLVRSLPLCPGKRSMY
jgi:hypothetical protein